MGRYREVGKQFSSDSFSYRLRLKVVINYHAQPSNYIRKAAAVKDNGGSGYGRGGFPASDIRYRSRDPEAESEAGTAAESLTSDLRDLRDTTSEWDTEYESLDPDISIRSSVPSSARSSAAASSARGTLLERLRNRRIAANL